MNPPTQRQLVRDMFKNTTHGIKYISKYFGISPITVYKYIKDIL